MKYGVTAGTGRFGERAIMGLIRLVPVEDIVVIARNTEKAKKMYPAGVEIRRGDYNDTESLDKAFDGIDKLLFVSSQPDPKHPRYVQHENVVNAATKAKVKFIAYTSFPHANIAKVPLAEDHAKTEKLITDTGIKHSFLRNNWYLENDADLIKRSANGEDFIFSAGDGKVGWAEEKYYAYAAAKVLASDEKTKDVYEFYGNEHTYADLAASVIANTSQDFKVRLLNDENYRKALAERGFEPGSIDFMVNVQDMIRAGVLDENIDEQAVKFGMTHQEILENNTDNDPDLPQVIGRPLPTLDEQVKDLLSDKPPYEI
ncbi:NAD(P)H-binding protein [Fructilactobacillus fructivorans]|uniref:NADPH:quinone oxidoreductase 2 n=1 Tax=Fructilactobacillus fructivorans TaxID=1614 RepID=A0A0C1LZF5_9LACO|nr:NAD(P)H-binding protein [Fructilactobacillus fructivorans]KID42250.1 NADPH:quinone oxidoreductase 2 [Fructilactobacillus fructivorans]MCT0151125.1 hypothetical protein [Fructilactobacillus fructivorans]MCT2867317.1 hypothetical protein [Fructilactobacillus fructivorans]MCT2869163.1 hypothetical protein [Fructilactobacillus fructivorans]MCT2873116.1 hypothetical protein [Fructilactobacillus fructivorans]